MNPKKPNEQRKNSESNSNKKRHGSNPESSTSSPKTPSKRLSFVPNTPNPQAAVTNATGSASPLKWECLPTTGKKPEKRGFHACTAVGNKFYVLGGDNRDKFFKDILVFDTKKSSWSIFKHGSLPVPRTGHTCSYFADKLYVFGGKQKQGQTNQTMYVADMSILDMSSLEWHNVKPVAPIKIRPRAAHSCCVVGSKLYIFGGLTCPTGKDEDLEYLDQLLVFDMVTCTWSMPQTKGNFPSARAGHSVTVFGNNMYIFGGRKGAVLLHDIYQLNTEKMIWTKVFHQGVLPKERAGHTTSCISNPAWSGMILWGGGDWSVFFQDVHLFDLETQEWTVAPSAGDAPTARFWHTSCMVENKMYVFGGGSKDSLFNDVHVLDLNPLLAARPGANASNTTSQDIHGPTSKPVSPSLNPQPILTVKVPPILSLSTPLSPPTPETFRIKISFNNEIRAFPQPILSTITFAELLKKIRDNVHSDVSINYVDDENDLITIRTDEELKNSFEFFAAKKKSIRFELKVVEAAPQQSQSAVPTTQTQNSTPHTPAAPAQAVPASPTPTSIKWHKGKILGQGAYGKVFLAMNLETSHFMAVKEIKLSGFPQTKENQIKDIANEINVMHKLKHENIVRYLGADRKDGYLYIFLEYVPGGSIASVLTHFKTLHEAVVRKYTKQILLGLQYLHANNIIHRDIKGANILVDDLGTVKLADFGHSKLQSLTETAKHTGIKGTPVYMAPETIMGKKPGKYADVWSLGCTIIEMLTGHLPWSEILETMDNQFALMHHISQAKRGPKYPANISVEGKRFLDKCFELNTEHRATVEDLLNEPFVINSCDVKAPATTNSITDNRESNDEDSADDDDTEYKPNEKSPCYEHMSLINKSFESYVSGDDDDDDNYNASVRTSNDDNRRAATTITHEEDNEEEESNEEEDEESESSEDDEEPPTPVNPMEKSLASLQKQLNNIDMARKSTSNMARKSILNFGQANNASNTTAAPQEQDAQIASLLRQFNSRRSPSLQVLNNPPRY